VGQMMPIKQLTVKAADKFLHAEAKPDVRLLVLLWCVDIAARQLTNKLHQRCIILYGTKWV